MWATVSGTRQLAGAEAVLLRAAIRHLLSELADQENHETGIDWFDQWDAEQKVWLLGSIADAFFTDAPPPPPAAILEASVDALFSTIETEIEAEIDRQNATWRERVIAAFESQHGPCPLSPVQEEAKPWRQVIAQLADAILGVACYIQAEPFRDGDYRRTESWLRDKGLPEDYLSRIPPLPTPSQTNATLQRIQQLLASKH